MPVRKSIGMEKMKNCLIEFKAIKSSGEVVRELSMTVGPFDEDSKVHICYLPLLRMCLEYARVRGVSCSYVEITDITDIEV